METFLGKNGNRLMLIDYSNTENRVSNFVTNFNKYAGFSLELFKHHTFLCLLSTLINCTFKKSICLASLFYIIQSFEN